MKGKLEGLLNVALEGAPKIFFQRAFEIAQKDEKNAHLKLYWWST